MRESPFLEVPQNGVDLWLIATAKVQGVRLLAQCHEILSEDERRQQMRFVFERDRHRYLVTRAALRQVLSRYEAVEPLNWRFIASEYGKPRVADSEVAARLSFNVSHTDGLIMIGVSAQAAIGVDVENVISRDVSLSVADHFFAPCEASALRALEPQHQLGRFFELWTLKEAYIKARGMGLSIPLHQFWFELDRHVCGIEVAFDAALQDTPSLWNFFQFKASLQHLGSVCVRAAGASPRLCVRQFVPHVLERIVSLPFQRTSNLAR